MIGLLLFADVTLGVIMEGVLTKRFHASLSSNQGIPPVVVVVVVVVVVGGGVVYDDGSEEKERVYSGLVRRDRVG